jgi:hypothetical protein
MAPQKARMLGAILKAERGKSHAWILGRIGGKEWTGDLWGVYGFQAA